MVVPGSTVPSCFLCPFFCSILPSLSLVSTRSGFDNSFVGGANDSHQQNAKRQIGCLISTETEREREETPNLLFGGEMEDDTDDEDDVMRSKSAGMTTDEARTEFRWATEF